MNDPSFIFIINLDFFHKFMIAARAIEANKIGYASSKILQKFGTQNLDFLYYSLKY